MAAPNAGIRHIPPAPPEGKWVMFLTAGGRHTTDENCPCKPQKIAVSKRTTTGRYGKHQGHNTTVSFQHNELPGDYS